MTAPKLCLAPTPEKRAELRALAKQCLDAIGPVGSSTAPFVRALRAYQEEARPEVLLSLLDALDAAACAKADAWHEGVVAGWNGAQDDENPYRSEP